MAATYSPDGDPLAITANKDKLSLWNVATSQLIKTFDGPKTQRLINKALPYGERIRDDVGPHPENVRAVKYSPDGETIAAIRHNESVQLWNISTGKHLGKPIIPTTHYTTSIRYSPDGKTIATMQISNRGDTVRLWNSATGKHIKTLKGHDKCSNSFTFSPDSKTIFTAHKGGTVLRWDIPKR
ncbi:hypothetical protein F4212_14960 [Candidatus Poribacteria bacterium]|nr:hypothetical protein [Candidatus Poribacteria bacterium]